MSRSPLTIIDELSHVTMSCRTSCWLRTDACRNEWFGGEEEDKAERTSAYDPLKRNGDFGGEPVYKYSRSDEDEVDYDSDGDKENVSV